MVHGRSCSTAAAAAGLAALLLAAPRPSAAAAALAGAASSTDPLAPVVAAVALLAWAVAGWLSLTAGVVLLCRVPGQLGRAARVLAGRVAPATVRRAVETALGLTVAVAALTPTAAAAATARAPAVGAPVGAEPAWDLDWPGRTRWSPTTARSPTATTTPAGTASASPGTPSPSTGPAPVLRTPATARRPVVGTLVVRAGDTLWSLAEASLRSAGTPSPTDRQVAQAWPRWWAANREAVGDDPDLLLPGTVLHPPTGGSGPA